MDSFSAIALGTEIAINTEYASGEKKFKLGLLRCSTKGKWTLQVNEVWRSVDPKFELVDRAQWTVGPSARMMLLIDGVTFNLFVAVQRVVV